MLLADADCLALRNPDHLFAVRGADLLVSPGPDGAPDPGFVAVRGARLEEFCGRLAGTGGFAAAGLRELAESGGWRTARFERGEVVSFVRAYQLHNVTSRTRLRSTGNYKALEAEILKGEVREGSETPMSISSRSSPFAGPSTRSCPSQFDVSFIYLPPRGIRGRFQDLQCFSRLFVIDRAKCRH